MTSQRKSVTKKTGQGVRYVALENLITADAETMTRVPPDGETLGEVMFRGNIVTKGHPKTPRRRKKLPYGGWFHSGDLGVIHPDGYIQLKDRSKDIIISGGEKHFVDRGRGCALQASSRRILRCCRQTGRQVG